MAAVAVAAVTDSLAAATAAAANTKISHMQYLYTLQPYRGSVSRYTCPGCNKTKTFTRYIDTETGQHINPTVGRCNRLINCGYHYTPKQYFADHRPLTTDDRRQLNTNHRVASTAVSGPPSVVQKPSYLSHTTLNQSLCSRAPNHFVTYLTTLFGAATTQQLIKRYHIGTAKHWPGATVFWQVDYHQQIRTGKIMLYSPVTGKRVKQPHNHITWAHTLLKRPGFNLQQCLFGQHLLTNPALPVAIAESEKTAIIASVYFPQFTWLAAGSLTNLTAQKCQVLKGRKVFLFPDLNAYQSWCSIADDLQSIATCFVSDLLERNASALQRAQGLDLADYLVGWGSLGRGEWGWRGRRGVNEQ